MYLHGLVGLPTPVTTLVWHSVYELVSMNIPEKVLELVYGIHWNIVPYPVNPVNWFIFSNLLRNVLDGMYYHTILDNRPVL